MNCQMLYYKVKTISDGGNEKSSEWENWEETMKSFKSGAALWIAAVVMPNDGLTSEHKIIITDDAGNDLYTFIIHPYFPFGKLRKSAKFALHNPVDGRVSRVDTIGEVSKLFLDGMMFCIGNPLRRTEREFELLNLKASNGRKIMSVWTVYI